MPLELWNTIFVSVSQQVDRAEIDPSADRLNIFIKGQTEPIQATHNELDDAFNNLGNDSLGLVHSFLKKHGVCKISQLLNMSEDSICGYLTNISEKFDPF